MMTPAKTESKDAKLSHDAGKVLDKAPWHELDETIEMMVTQLSLPEKLSLISGRDMWTLANRTLIFEKFPDIYSKFMVDSSTTQDIPPPSPFRVSDGPHGLRKTFGDGHSNLNSVEATCFPTTAALACSWDEQLVYQVGKAIAIEARHHDVDLILAPAMNIQRHPCGGRSFEYFSEDPLLTGRLASAIVQGIQQRDDASVAAVGACLKHICVNNQETRRAAVNILVDPRKFDIGVGD